MECVGGVGIKANDAIDKHSHQDFHFIKRLA